MPITIRAVAYKAGVSVGTVSNVLNRPSYVSVEIRERVEAAIAELGFVPTKNRQRFPAGRQRVLGCVVADLSHPFFADVVLAAEEEATRLDAAMVICHSGNSVEREERNLRTLIQLRVQGIIVAPVADRTPGIEGLRERGVPLVYLDRLDPKEEIQSVLVDHRQGGRLAAQHLLDHGHTSFAFVGVQKKNLSVVKDRILGFEETIRDAGLDSSKIVQYSVDNWTSEVSGAKSGLEYVAEPADRRATGIFCANDLLARGFLSSCRTAGVSAPKNFSVIGYDDLNLPYSESTLLTTVKQPRIELGQEAVILLAKQISGEESENRVVLQPELEIRGSTGPAPDHS